MRPRGTMPTSVRPVASVSAFELAFQPLDARGVFWMLGLSERPGGVKSARESHAFEGLFTHSRKYQLKVMFQQVLDYACRNGDAEVGLCVFAPTQRKLPNCVRLVLDEE